MNLYSIYDAVSLIWMAPVMQRTDGEAARGFSAAVADPQHDFLSLLLIFAFIRSVLSIRILVRLNLLLLS